MSPFIAATKNESSMFLQKGKFLMHVIHINTFISS